MTTMSDAASSGDRALALRTLRDKLATAIDQAEPKEMAQLSRQMQAVLAELAQVDVPTEGSKSDELRRRRAARLAGSDAPGGPAVGQ